MPDCRILTITRFTLLEALRTRLPWLFGALLLLACIAAWFMHALAITESTRIQAGIYAETIRLVGVFVLALHVIASMTREFQDKGLELALSFDLRRGEYLLGRLCGFLITAIVIAGISALPLLLLSLLSASGELAGEPALLQWTLSLASELALVAALALFSVVTFTQIIPAASFTFAFYALSRMLDAIQLMSNTPLDNYNQLSHTVTHAGISVLAFVMPTLDRFTQADWLVAIDHAAGISWLHLGSLVAQAGIYIALLAAAAMFDFYRRNF